MRTVFPSLPLSLLLALLRVYCYLMKKSSLTLLSLFMYDESDCWCRELQGLYRFPGLLSRLAKLYALYSSCEASLLARFGTTATTTTATPPCVNRMYNDGFLHMPVNAVARWGRGAERLARRQRRGHGPRCLCQGVAAFSLFFPPFREWLCQNNLTAACLLAISRMVGVAGRRAARNRHRGSVEVFYSYFVTRTYLVFCVGSFFFFLKGSFIFLQR